MCTSKAFNFRTDVNQAEAALFWVSIQGSSFNGLKSAGPNKRLNLPVDFGDNCAWQCDDGSDIP